MGALDEDGVTVADQGVNTRQRRTGVGHLHDLHTALTCGGGGGGRPLPHGQQEGGTGLRDQLAGAAVVREAVMESILAL